MACTFQLPMETMRIFTNKTSKSIFNPRLKLIKTARDQMIHLMPTTLLTSRAWNVSNGTPRINYKSKFLRRSSDPKPGRIVTATNQFIQLTQNFQLHKFCSECVLILTTGEFKGLLLLNLALVFFFQSNLLFVTFYLARNFWINQSSRRE